METVNWNSEPAAPIEDLHGIPQSLEANIEKIV
jgi:hypothetical protein